jgi:hypothetical protein
MIFGVALAALLVSCAGDPEYEAAEETVDPFRNPDSYAVPECGNDACEPGESRWSCPEDCTEACAAGEGGSAHLAIVPEPQRKPHQCWAAVVAMVAAQMRIETSQCALATALAKADGLAVDCCSPASSSDAACDRTEDPGYAMQQFLGLGGDLVDGPVPADVLQASMRRGSGAFVFVKEGGFEHVILAAGADEEEPGSPTFHVIDPGSGVRDRPYDWIAGGMGFGATWYRTITDIRPLRTAKCR